MRRWLLLFCFDITRRELDRWYRKNARNLTHSDWKENYQVLNYLKKYSRYQLRGKQKEGLKKPSFKPLDKAYRISKTIKVNKPADE